jgi:hypothetical protein
MTHFATSGGSPWLSARAGYQRFDSRLHNERGAGFSDFMKTMAQKALELIRKHIVPVIVRNAPSVAKTLSEYAVTKGREYVKRSRGREGPVTATIEQALEDLPELTARLIRKYEEVRRAQESKTVPDVSDRGGFPNLQPAEIAQIVAQLIMDCIPQLRKELNAQVRPKLEAAITFADPYSRYNTQQVEQVFDYWKPQPRPDCDPIKCLAKLCESMMQAAIIASDAQPQNPLAVVKTGALNLVNNGRSMFNVCRMLQDLQMQMAADVNRPVDQTALSMMLMGLGDFGLYSGAHRMANSIPSRLALQYYTPASSSKQVARRQTSQDERGGFLPLIPLAAAGIGAIPGLITGIVDLVKWWRGSGERGGSNYDPLVTKIMSFLHGNGFGDVLSPSDVALAIQAAQSQDYMGSDLDEAVAQAVKQLLESPGMRKQISKAKRGVASKSSRAKRIKK